LWITRGILEKHRGSIRMKSRTQQDSHGTVFSIFLPGEYATDSPDTGSTEGKRNKPISAGDAA